MKKLFLLLILSFFSTQGLAGHSSQHGVDMYYQGQINKLVAAQNNSEASTSQSVDNLKFERSHKFNQPRITQAFCTEASDEKHSNIKRSTTKEYWSTYLGGIVNHQSLKEFFSITNGQYSSNCDEWFRTYVNLPFHKVLVFSYDRNIIDITGYWAISLSTLNRGEAKRFGLEACKDTHSSHKIESFTCSILFGNNDIENKDYLALAKMSEDEYIKTITNYEDENYRALQATQSESTESADYIEKIKEAKSLLDLGIITYGEFEKMKQKIIDNM
jgi:hypothetical protein